MLSKRVLDEYFYLLDSMTVKVLEITHDVNIVLYKNNIVFNKQKTNNVLHRIYLTL